MWLAETAVDLPTLEMLAEHGIRFTLLAPRQARRVRHLEGGEWQDVGGGQDRPHAPLPRAPALGAEHRPVLLRRADLPGRRLRRAAGRRGAFRPPPDGRVRRGAGRGRSSRTSPPTAKATGTTTARGTWPWPSPFRPSNPKGWPALTIYGEYLERHPPECEVEIFENSSWSCVHGVERWRSDCGCNSGGRPGWNQQWRAPLREALDWLRDTLAPAYAEHMQALGFDPWRPETTTSRSCWTAARTTWRRFFSRHGDRELDARPEDAGHPAPRAPAARHADVHELRLVLRRRLRPGDRSGDPVRRAAPCSSPSGCSETGWSRASWG